MLNIGRFVMLIACIVLMSNANAIGQGAAADTATQILHAYKSKQWAQLAGLSTGGNRQLLQNLAAGSEKEKSFTSGWRWEVVNNWNGVISEVRYSTNNAGDGWTEYSAYAKFGASGDECFVVAMELGVIKWNFEDISSPDCKDFNSYSTTSEIVTSTVPEKKYKEGRQSYDRVPEKEMRTEYVNNERQVDNEPDITVDSATKDAYRRYIAAYNKLTQLMSHGKGDTPAAQRAFKEYTYEKQRYEDFLKEKEANKSKSKNIQSGVISNNSSGNAAGSKKEAYAKYMAAYRNFTRMVRETPILGPPEMKKISDSYHQNLAEYNRSKDRRAYQSYIAALNHLNSMALKVYFTGPPALKKAQKDYQRARAEYSNLIQR